ncbi:glycosyltransferase family 2 protein [Sphingomonas gei]|uniref:Glycosyltransferase family 2 protein n=1 Tax=Sphingomonas gei TaxID=1395960 RepID=A0A4S1XDG3_9SPHN|nr:glycosyltransferase family 2 protein [Sphingomonas gei]TGX53500.1 glycosyltransferase family 2 protein [Sphingomonas gei]
MSGALVVVPTLNEQEHIGALLGQLRADPAALRIVVADGGSTDDTRRIVAEHAAADSRVMLLDNPDRIQSAGINDAVARFGDTARWLVRVDAHCLYPDDYAGGLVATAEAVGAVSVVVPMQTRGVHCFQIACAAAQNSVLGTGGSAHRHVGHGQFVEHGHHALMDIAAFRGAGGYNQAMSHNEDAELDHRLGTIGRIWLEPAHAITYFPRRDMRGLWRQYRGYGKGRAQTIALHRMRPRLRQLIPLAPPLALLLALGSPWLPILAVPALAWALLCLVAGIAIGARQRSRCAMLAGVAAMIMHAAWGTGFLAQWLFGRTPAAIAVRSLPQG